MTKCHRSNRSQTHLMNYSDKYINKGFLGPNFISTAKINVPEQSTNISESKESDCQCAAPIEEGTATDSS